MKRLTSSLLCTIFGAASLFAASNASAALQIELETGGSTTTYIDTTDDGIFAIGGINPVDFITIGDWTVRVTTGTAYPDAGPGVPNPELLLTSVEATSTATSGTSDLKIRLTNTGFTLAAGTYNVNLGSSLTLAGNGTTLDTNFYFDSSDAAFGQGTPLGSSTQLVGGTLADSFNGGTNFTTLGTDFSFSIETIISHNGAGTSNIGASIKVPEPATIALLGLGLVLVGFATRRRKEDNTQELAA